MINFEKKGENDGILTSVSVSVGRMGSGLS